MSFFNPYNFVPTPKRTPENTPAGLEDSAPCGHHRLFEDRWSGTITVKMEAATPLLVPSGDMQEMGENRHKVKQTRILNGLPDIPPSSVKGMIRSAFEAMTNSRFGEFVDHDQKLAFRQEARSGLLAMPAIVCKGGETIEICSWDSQLGNPRQTGTNAKQSGFLAAPWVFTRDLDRLGLRHGDKVEFNYREESRGPIKSRIVTKIRKAEPDEDENFPEYGRLFRSGVTHLNDPRINPGKNKHYERVFVLTDDPLILPLSAKVKSDYKYLIAKLRAEHSDEVEKYADYIRSGDEWSELVEGSMCYVHLVANGSGWDVSLAQPVQIGSQLHPNSPLDLLDSSLHPATDIDALSPADRVFGWVHESGGDSKISAYAGAVRFGAVKCLSNDALEDLGKGQTLPILDRPKTQQSRFYVGEDMGRTIEPLKNGLPKQDVQYKSGGGRALRGRKVFPHQAGFKDPNRAEPGKQNQTVKNRVRAGSKFEFTLHVRNLSDIELGALLHLLSLNDGRGSGESPLFNKIGGGKPFGFGSVKLDIDWDRTVLATGNEISNSLLGFSSVPQTTVETLRDISQRFQEAVRTQSYYKAFKIACQGYGNGQAVHYPMISPGTGDGEDILKWFVENERLTESQRGLSLPKLTNDSSGQLPGHPPRQRRY